MLAAGTVVDGRYEIVGPLAEGGMGSVFRARRVLLGDDVALKIVRWDVLADPGARVRFLSEGKACARLRHPNIVSILDYNLDADGRPFLVMELLNGRSLRQEIAARGPLPLDEVQAIVAPLCGALKLAHDQGILHRDLKSANIVAHDFGGGSRVHKIVDFGLVRLMASDSTRITGAHQFLGTLSYAAPEQILGGDADVRSDQYSLAVVTYELLTGRTPFEESDAVPFLNALLTKAFPPPTTVCPNLPKWIDLVLGRALAKKPEDRYDSIADFGDALRAGAGTGSNQPTIQSGRATSAPATGRLLATYEIGERLGPGRLGSEVFKGMHRALGHAVAIRLLRRGAEPSWDAVRARFLREARTLQVGHPSIIQVRDYGEEGDLVYLVTEFIAGRSLREVLRTGGAMPWSRLAPMLTQFLEAARVLHAKGGLLSGLSPEIMRVVPDDEGERLMISAAGIWQPADLLATMGDATLRGTALTDIELHYVAPEILTGQNADVRSDVFTIGVLAYEMATAVWPYDGASMPALLGAMLRGRPASPRAAQPTLPEPAVAALLKALAPAPEDRFPTARALAAALL